MLRNTLPNTLLLNQSNWRLSIKTRTQSLRKNLGDSGDMKPLQKFLWKICSEVQNSVKDRKFAKNFSEKDGSPINFLTVENQTFQKLNLEGGLLFIN